MIKNVIISRKNDALIFYEMNDEIKDNDLLFTKNKAYEFLKDMKSKKINGEFDTELQPYIMYYHIENNIVYSIITYKKFSKLAFIFLEDLNARFIGWLKMKFETKDIFSKLQAITQKNFAMNFDNSMREIKYFWENKSEQSNIEKLHREIKDINKIILENINSFIERDTHLNEVDSLSKSVLSNSIKFEKAARNTRIKMQNDRYTIFIGISIIIFFVILFKLL